MAKISGSAVKAIIEAGEASGFSADDINDAVQRAAEEVSEGRLEGYAVRSAFSTGISDGGTKGERNCREMAMKAEIVGILRTHEYLSFEGPLLDATCESLAEKILAAVDKSS